MNKKPLYIIVILFLIGCSASKVADLSQQKEKLKSVIHEKYSDEGNISYNVDGSFALVVKQEKSSPGNPSPPFRFFIYNMEEAKIEFEDTGHSGSVRWKDNDKVEVLTVPGIIRENDNRPYGYIYNIKSKSKIELYSSKEK